MWNNEWSWCEWCFVHLGHTYIVVVAWICVCLQSVEQWLCRREEKGGGRILGWLPPHLLIRLIVTSLFSTHHFHIIKYSTVSKYSKGWLQASSKILPFYQNKAIPLHIAMFPLNPPFCYIYIKYNVCFTISIWLRNTNSICMHCSPTCSPLGVGSSQIPPGTGSLSWRGLCVCAQSYYLDQQLKRHIQSYHMDC